MDNGSIWIGQGIPVSVGSVGRTSSFGHFSPQLLLLGYFVIGYVFGLLGRMFGMVRLTPRVPGLSELFRKTISAKHK